VSSSYGGLNSPGAPNHAPSKQAKKDADDITAEDSGAFSLALHIRMLHLSVPHTVAEIQAF
jgi:hypothetical protein